MSGARIEIAEKHREAESRSIRASHECGFSLSPGSRLPEPGAASRLPARARGRAPCRARTGGKR